jgi:hypothetical protein
MDQEDHVILFVGIDQHPKQLTVSVRDESGTPTPKSLCAFVAWREASSVRLPYSLRSLRFHVVVLFSAVSLYLIIIYIYIVKCRGKM